MSTQASRGGTKSVRLSRAWYFWSHFLWGL